MDAWNPAYIGVEPRKSRAGAKEGGLQLEGGPAGETDRPGASTWEGGLKLEEALAGEMDQPSPDSSSVCICIQYNFLLH